MAGLDRISAVLALESNMPVRARAPARARAARAAGVRARRFSYPGGERGPARRDVRARARQDLRARRADRRRQDDDRLADGAALRPDARARAARRPRHPLVRAGGTRGADRLHPAGAVPLHRHHPRQHRLRHRGSMPTTPATSCVRLLADQNLERAGRAASTRDSTRRSRRAARPSAWARSSSSPSCARCCAIRRS